MATRVLLSASGEPSESGSQGSQRELSIALRVAPPLWPDSGFLSARLANWSARDSAVEKRAAQDRTSELHIRNILSMIPEFL